MSRSAISGSHLWQSWPLFCLSSVHHHAHTHMHGRATICAPGCMCSYTRTCRVSVSPKGLRGVRQDRRGQHLPRIPADSAVCLGQLQPPRRLR
jgi:hypothetical protein